MVLEFGNGRFFAWWSRLHRRFREQIIIIEDWILATEMDLQPAIIDSFSDEGYYSGDDDEFLDSDHE
jgi:hypothetical protein